MAKRNRATTAESTGRGGESGNESKADLIRQTAKQLGKRFRPRDIVNALGDKGITVGYTQIAKALKAGGFRKRRRGKGAGGSGKVVKAERIREVAKSLGRKVRPRDIVAELANEGITVSPAQVSTTLRAAGFRRRKRRRALATVGAAKGSRFAGHGLDLEALIATKALVQKVGSIETAEEALRALRRLG